MSPIFHTHIPVIAVVPFGGFGNFSKGIFKVSLGSQKTPLSHNPHHFPYTLDNFQVFWTTEDVDKLSIAVDKLNPIYSPIVSIVGMPGGAAQEYSLGTK